MVPNEEFHSCTVWFTICFEPPKREVNLYNCKGQNAWSQGVLYMYMEVPLLFYSVRILTTVYTTTQLCDYSYFLFSRMPTALAKCTRSFCSSG